MAIMTYAEFKTKYQSGYGLATSTQLSDAYRQYRLKGTLPTSTAPVITTPTTTTMTTEEQATYAEEHYPTANLGMIPGYNPAAMSWAEYIKLLEAGGYSTAGLVEPGVTAPPTTPTVEEQIALMPEVPTPEAPELAPAPEVAPPPTVEAPEVPTIPEVAPPPTVEAPEVPLAPTVEAPVMAPAPTVEAPVVTPAPIIPAIKVAPAPEYAPTEEERAWAEMYGGTIQDIIEARGEGIPEETINLMIRQQTQLLTAREDENLRIMHNDMERRGITNSGLVFWNQQKIKSATTTALANSITDIQIKSSLMKMASFENALGHAGQFLGYLQEQSKMVFVGKMATWEAQTQANLIQYQAQISSDMEQWKMVNQFGLAAWEAQTGINIEAWRMENQFTLAKWEAQTGINMEAWRMRNQALFAKWEAQTIADRDEWRMRNEYNLINWQANTQALFAQWDKNSTAMVEAWKMDNVFSMEEWGTRANYDMAAFQIQTQALMAEWAAQMDIYKLSITQAYLQDNINLAAQIAADAAEQQNIWDVEAAEILLEAQQAAAAAEGAGELLGGVSGIIASMVKPS